jgi:PRC-barrel domain protein
MSITQLIRIIGTAGVVVAVPLVTAMAQTQPPPPSPASPPAATQPQPSAPPAAPQATTPTDKKAAAPAAIGDLVGLNAKSSDGTNLGTVYGATMEPGGKVTAIGVKVGGFLGFGGHMVVIPDGKLNRVGDTVQINMTADEVHKLPEAKKQS